MNRRDFNKTALLAGGAALAGATAYRFGVEGRAMAQGLPALPDPASSGIDHIVVVTMENRSFDHFLGWLPNADGRQAGLAYLDSHGVAHATHSLSGDNTGCPSPDPEHSYSGARAEYNGGSMDGFLRAGSGDTYPIGYYGEHDIPFLAALARHYTTLDRYFAAILGPTFPNRMFLHAAQTDRLDNSVGLSSLPTIWDRLDAARVSHAYYFNNVPYLALWGIKYAGIARLFNSFKEDAAKGTLPAVSFLDPRYTILDDGSGNDDHPHADIREGDRFLYNVFHALSTGPEWSSTVLVINFDEWGGFFDHVPPPRAAAANAVDTDIVAGKTLLGFRLPTVVASPFNVGNPENPSINSLTFDHTSVLKLIEWRWGLDPLTPRDASGDVHNLAYTFDFANPQTAVPRLPKPHTPWIALPCFEDLIGGIFDSRNVPGGLAEGARAASKRTAVWSDLRSVAAQSGFPVG